jgi:hypothetical protein
MRPGLAKERVRSGVPDIFEFTTTTPRTSLDTTDPLLQGGMGGALGGGRFGAQKRGRQKKGGARFRRARRACAPHLSTMQSISSTMSK